MKVLVNGIGNIGTTIIHLLLEYQGDFDIDKIFASRKSFHDWNKSEMDILREMGVELISADDLESLYPQLDYVFECAENGVGKVNKSIYSDYQNLKASAQGSEKGFGISFMSGVNENLIRNDRFVHVVSCNTHGTASLLQTLCGDKLENLKSGDFVVVRRSEDVGQHQRLVGANVVARHLNENIGTHHAIDVVDMYKSAGIDCSITSSDITTPSQLMHSVRFNIEFKIKPTKSISELIVANPYLSTTKKFDSNAVFELGRRYGYQGRLYSHAIVISDNLIVTDKSVKGWAFVPQEGNTILSTLHAFILQCQIIKGEILIEKLKNQLLRLNW